MPSQHIGSFLTEKEKATVDETCERLGITRYRLFKNALKEYCESKLKEGKELDRGKTEGKPEISDTTGKNGQHREENSLDNDIFS